ncbi:MAG: VOC family protein [Candidatus Methylacidiphilales bacterium]
MHHEGVSISLTVKDGVAALDFYAAALGGKELYRLPTPEGGIGHAEFMIGDAKIYLSEESPEWHAYAMPEGTTASCLFSIATPECDASYQRAVSAGAQALSEPQDFFWGARSAIIKDPYGYRWAFVQMIEQLTPEEVAERAQKIYG